MMNGILFFMTFSEKPRFDEIFLHLEIEAVTRELSILDETRNECSGPHARKSFERAKMELLRDPAAYMVRQAEIAKITWENQPALAKYMYQENDKD